ncbi:MAG: carbohydrate ABC transporter permease [Anaerolineales bacterium]|nr:carbohydrate ABC transporter permease [Anaerolineales bacterium]
MNRMGMIDRGVTYLFLTVLGLLLAAPFVYMISMALSSDATSAQLTFTFIPREFEFGNFVRVFTSRLNFGRFLWNSLILVFFAVIGQVFVSSLVAYAFARLRAPGKEVIFILLLSTLMIPAEVTLIPQFVLFSKLGWVNTLLPIIVPNFFGGAYNIFLLRQFITRIPVELDEAAQIDGLNYFGIYARIIVPLIFPALVAVAIFTFVWNWGAFFGPLIYINDVEKMPLALGVQILSATNSAGQIPPWNLVMVGALILTVPMILVYFFGQRFMDQFSLTGGSVGVK